MVSWANASTRQQHILSRSRACQLVSMYRSSSSGVCGSVISHHLADKAAQHGLLARWICVSGQLIVLHSSSAAGTQLTYRGCYGYDIVLLPFCIAFLMSTPETEQHLFLWSTPHYGTCPVGSRL